MGSGDRYIHQLEEEPFDSNKIDHMFYVQKLNEPGMNRVNLKNVFEWIKESAQKEEGLTVEFTGEQIIFIKGKKNNNNC